MLPLLCNIGIPILIAAIFITQIIIPLFTGEKVFWIFRRGGGKTIDQRYNAALREVEKQNKTKH